jgi:beta-glucosidase
MTRTFPPGFLWGATTGAHKTEGNNLASDWCPMEDAPDTTIAGPSGDAVDTYHRRRQDMDLATDAGFAHYRFGIECSRAEPTDGRNSHAEMAHYGRMVAGAIERGLRPLPTLHHFTHALWFTLSGGWSRPAAVERFLRYVDALAPVLGAGVQRMETINGSNILASMGKLRAAGAGNLAPGPRVPHAAVTHAIIAVLQASRMRLKERRPEVLVGWGVSVQDYQAGPGAGEALARYVYPRDEMFLEAARGDDWVGVQAYTRGRIAVVGGEPVAVRDPAALGGAVDRVALVVDEVTLVVTENGTATAYDACRVAFTAEAFDSLEAALEDGVDVRGYLHWSVLDNDEWGSYGPTFGLVAVDRVTFQRAPRPSLAWLGWQLQ